VGRSLHGIDGARTIAVGLIDASTPPATGKCHVHMRSK